MKREELEELRAAIASSPIFAEKVLRVRARPQGKFRKGDRVRLTREGWTSGILSTRLYTGRGTVTGIKQEPHLVRVLPERFDSIKSKVHTYHVDFWQLDDVGQTEAHVGMGPTTDLARSDEA